MCVYDAYTRLMCVCVCSLSSLDMICVYDDIHAHENRDIFSQTERERRNDFFYMNMMMSVASSCSVLV